MKEFAWKTEKSHSPSKQAGLQLQIFITWRKSSWAPTGDMGVATHSTYRSIQLPLLIHPQIESTVHASDADQAHGYTDEFQNA